ncbi:MAG: heterodisulfide reductase subunit [Desulfovibrionales bacterium]|jgi:heterodisulfide reductase subunit B|nr:heterodisulfide reductase subunit [Desulfovibrionales bacterium]
MKYAYYPGCSLSETAKEFDVSTRKALARLGVELAEIPDWTCCGASAAEAVSELLSLALPGRNLALAGRELPGLDVLAPCSACYLNLLRVEKKTERDPDARRRIDEALSVQNLALPGTMRVRHLLDALVNDVGLPAIAEKVVSPLEGLKAAPYYGCQILRPYAEFDDPERPRTMALVLEALGAEPLDWRLSATCCGASLMASKKEAALPLVGNILRAARDAGADVVATVCPLCQMNLEAYQSEADPKGPVPLTVAYLPQLMGLAFGMDPEEVMFGKNMAVAPGFLAGAPALA